MGHDDITTDHSQTTHEPGPEVSARTAAPGGRQGEPLFRRFGVSKEWRTKDNGVG